MATTVTLRPTALFKRQSSSYWTNYARAYDGDEDTYSDNCGYQSTDFKVDLSSIPANAIIKSGYIRVLYYRSGGTSDIPRCGFTYYAGTTTGSAHTSLSFEFCGGTTYRSKEWTSTPVFSFTEAQQTAWRNAGTTCISCMGSTGRVYEIQFVLTYEEPSKIFVGGSQVSGVYVGTTKATAVYIGNTKIL